MSKSERTHPTIILESTEGLTAFRVGEGLGFSTETSERLAKQLKEEFKTPVGWVIVEEDDKIGRRRGKRGATAPHILVSTTR